MKVDKKYILELTIEDAAVFLEMINLITTDFVNANFTGVMASKVDKLANDLYEELTK